jgi:hypothetical protein
MMLVYGVEQVHLDSSVDIVLYYEYVQAITCFSKITAVAVGNLVTNASEHRPIVCVVNAEGAIFLFLVKSVVCQVHVH